MWVHKNHIWLRDEFRWIQPVRAGNSGIFWWSLSSTSLTWTAVVSWQIDWMRKSITNHCSCSSQFLLVIASSAATSQFLTTITTERHQQHGWISLLWLITPVPSINISAKEFGHWLIQQSQSVSESVNQAVIHSFSLSVYWVCWCKWLIANRSKKWNCLSGTTCSDVSNVLSAWKTGTFGFVWIDCFLIVRRTVRGRPNLFFSTLSA